MKWLFASLMICLVGCLKDSTSCYVRQTEELERRLNDGEFASLNGVDMWGRKWRLMESYSERTNDLVNVFLTYRSYGEDLANDMDDIEVFVHQHFRGNELLSWGYSYYYHIGNSIVTGGCEFD